jgi:hypothetical protein
MKPGANSSLPSVALGPTLADATSRDAAEEALQLPAIQRGIKNLTKVSSI